MAGNPQLLAEIRAKIDAYCDGAHDFAFDPADPVVRLHEPTFSAPEINAALDVMLSTFVTQGAKVRAFEDQFAAYMGARFGVMSNSGSSANLLAIAAIANPDAPNALQRGDEVIVPALSWSTTVWPIIQMGLIPVIVDIDPVTLNLDPNAVEAAIGPRTRALMPVHVYGNPCDMDALLDICKRHGLLLVEDCCEALGASYDGRAVGTIGDLGTYSFYFSHHICTFEGGITVSNRPEMDDLMRILRAHGWVREVREKEAYTRQHPEIDPRFLFVNLGYNLRAMEIQGAMGSVQLHKLREYVEVRRANAAFWQEAFKPFDKLVAVQHETPKGHHSWFGFPMILRENAPFEARELRDHLEAAKIETRPIICGNIARQPALKKYEHRVHGDLAHASAVMDRGVAFGNHQAVNAEAREYVRDKVVSFLERFGNW